MKHLTAKLALSVAFAALAGPLAAQSAGDFTIGLGFATVAPKSDNGTVGGAAATISDNTQLSLTAEYFIRDNLGLEVLAATPFSHNIYLGGVNQGTTKHLPPTVSLKYHFPTGGALTPPFVGLGVNYTVFFDDSSPLGDLRLKNSWGGLAAAAGVTTRSAIPARCALKCATWTSIPRCSWTVPALAPPKSIRSCLT